MTAVSAQDVFALRARTGVSILACKQALEDAEGDQEKAIEILRKRGIAQAVKKADRAQSEGAIFIAENGSVAAIVVLKCETDFVARNPDFVMLGQQFADLALKEGIAAAQKDIATKLPDAIQKLGENLTVEEIQEIAAPALSAYVHSNRKVAVVVGAEPAGADRMKLRDAAMHAAALNPVYVRPDEVSDDVIAKEREIWTEQMKGEKKPEAILEKIMLGKEKKFREENALLTQAFVKDPSMTVEKYLGDVKVTSYVRVTV